MPKTDSFSAVAAMSDMAAEESDPLQRVPALPIPISLIAGRYLLFDIDAAIYLRRAHNICGYNIGTLHLIPSQNGFLGLPMILMPEEAQLLVDQGIGYVVDDAAIHERVLYDRRRTHADAYRADAQRQADAIGDSTAKAQAERKRQALARPGLKARNIPRQDTDTQKPADDLLTFDDTASITTDAATSTAPANSFFVTPTSSQLLLAPQPSDDAVSPKPTLPNVPVNYPLFRHLHSRGYFMTPGLRFGCQYTTYPGDPLRFHSHFLTADFSWNKDINLMDIVGGGRLGTGVKKGFLVGGHVPSTQSAEGSTNLTAREDKVRTFSIEWAVM